MKALMMVRGVVLAWLLTGGMAVNLAAAAPAVDPAWTQSWFTGNQVSLVQANPARPDQMAAVADNRLWTSADGGLTWRQPPLLPPVQQIEYDPVYPERVYAGTQRGVYASRDFGLSWTPLGDAFTQRLVVMGLAVGRDYVFAAQYNGAGSFSRIHRFNRDGHTTVLPPIGAEDPGPLFIDQTNQQLYAGTRGTLYRSASNGDSWTGVAGLPEVGFNTVRIAAKGAEIWQLSAQGPYRSANNGADWVRLASAKELPELHYNSDAVMNGLTVNRGSAYVSFRHNYSNNGDVLQMSPGSITRLGLQQRVNAVTDAGDKLWAATDNGLWVRHGLVGSEAQVKRPVVVVPGILGSWKKKGEWILEPIFHTYGPLRDQLQAVGYVENQTLFEFGYDWRQDNEISGRQLNQKIEAIKGICTCPKVDIVGHSMGGLVARAYIQGDDYDGDVNGLIQLGTPNAGSTDSYSVWEAGTSSANELQDRLKFRLFNLLAFKNGYTNLTDYVRDKVVSVQQLLPVYSYITGRTYPDGYPRNYFLERLNQPDRLKNLRERVQLFIIGSDRHSTMSGVTVSDPRPNDKNWPHGEIQSKQYGSGDATVPLSSLASIGPISLIVGQNHGDLAAQPSDRIPYLLLGGSVSQFSLKDEIAKKYLLIYVKSPVRLSIVDPLGRVINDERNDVYEAFFTGSDEEVQFITVPNPLLGNYSIKLTGKGDGKYTVGVSAFGEDAERDQTDEFDFRTSPGVIDEFSYDTESSNLKPVSLHSEDPDGPNDYKDTDPGSSRQASGGEAAHAGGSQPLHGPRVRVDNTLFAYEDNLDPTGALTFEDANVQDVPATGKESQTNQAQVEARRSVNARLLFILIASSATIVLILWLTRKRFKSSQNL